jgi:outer membrane lipoprotein-sorting protein
MKIKLSAFPVSGFLLMMMLFLLPFQTQAQQAFNQLTGALEDGQVFKASFSHLFVDVFTQDSSLTSGEIVLNKNGYAVDMDERSIVVQDSVSEVYNKANNQVIISRYVPEDDDFAPGQLIYATKNEYSISEENLSTGVRISLEPNDPFATFRSVIMKLSEKGLPKHIEAIDQGENLNKTTFSDGRLTSQQPGDFKLDYPASAEIVDLRAK